VRGATTNRSLVGPKHGITILGLVGQPRTSEPFCFGPVYGKQCVRGLAAPEMDARALSPNQIAPMLLEQLQAQNPGFPPNHRQCALNVGEPETDWHLMAVPLAFFQFPRRPAERLSWPAHYALQAPNQRSATSFLGRFPFHISKVFPPFPPVHRFAQHAKPLNPGADPGRGGDSCPSLLP